MKKLLFTIFLISIPLMGMAYTSPGKVTGYVNDFANILSPADKQIMESKLVSLKQTTDAEVSVVTVSTLGNDETIESYAVKFFAEQGLGVKGKDNGVLILVAPNEREVRIEVGYGLEGDLTDIQSGIIIRDVMIPAFKENNYAKGIGDAVDAVIAIVSHSPDAEQYLQSSAGGSASNPSRTEFNFSFIVFVVIILFNIFARILGKTKSWWLGGVIGAIIGAVVGLIFGSIIVGLPAIIILTILGLIFDYFVSKNPPKSGGDGKGGIFPIFFGGGHGGFGGGGGGFGGFGGGMSGGGGASGRW